MLRLLRTAVAALAVFATGTTGAEDAFYRAGIRDLVLTEGTLPDVNEDLPRRSWWRLRDLMQPYAVLDGQGEVYVWAEEVGGRWDAPRSHLAVRAATGKDVTGWLFWPKPDLGGMAAARFMIPASGAASAERGAFYRAKLRHYNGLLNRGVPGAAWFRHQAREARKQLPRDQADDPNEAENLSVRRTQTSELSDTYALFSGGRAMSENLQLDRVLPEPQGSDELIELDSIQGITIPEIDWSQLTKDVDPELDPLATTIPFDQHAVFFARFADFMTMVDEVQAHGAMTLQVFEPRSEDSGTFARYERQLGLSLTTVARLLGPQLTSSVAMTGSDPYFRTGTDVAFLFEAVDPVALEGVLSAQIAAAAALVQSSEPVRGKAGGVGYLGFRAADRSICCYLATFGKTVAVTNSLYQIERLARVHTGEIGSIAGLPEYKFFRARYRRGDPVETAFVFLSDATIRRWCGPRWRILTSRRTRDVGVIAELQANHMDRLAAGGFPPGPIYTDLPLAARGTLTLAPDGVYGEAVGSLAFMTPIAEMPIGQVTKAEAEAYARWRDGYERNWTGVFDPIGLQLGVRADQLAADLTVMPLIGGSEYRDLIAVSRGAKIGPDAGDPHDALTHLVLALNKDSEIARRYGSVASTLMPSARINPLGWVGGWAAWYFDDDPLWAELATVPYDQRDKFFQENLGRIPVALVVDVENGFQLAAFLTAVRAFIEQTVPAMTNWESRTYRDEPYVKITPSTRAQRQEGQLGNLAVYYSASAESLILSLSEGVLQRALDRRIARRTAGAEDGTGATEPMWLGANLCLNAPAKAVTVLSVLFTEDYQLAMQKRAWANLPILNEWKRRYPDQDPLDLHARVWKVRLRDPAGGRYVWDAEFRTMASTVYGHPGKPNKGPAAPPLAAGILGANFGVTVEQQGLRARVELSRKAAGSAD